MMVRPDPENRYKVWRAAAIVATVRQPWVLGALALVGIAGLYAKLVSTALQRLYEIYVSWGATRATATVRVRQAAGVCLVVIWVVCFLVVVEYHQWWLAFKAFSISTLVFDVFCGLVDWQARRAEHADEAPEHISLDDLLARQEMRDGAEWKAQWPSQEHDEEMDEERVA